jgi:hypothetical protein
MTKLHFMLCVLALYCGPVSGEDQLKELNRLRAPDRLVDAVVSERPVDATVSTPYYVFVVPTGTIPDEDDAVLKVDRTDPPAITWDSKSKLTIRCKDARVWSFRNFATTQLQDGQFADYAIALSCGQAGFEF